MGLRWYEFDLGWYALNVFRALGLIHGLRSAEGAPREASHSRGAQA
jgi:fatty-acid desaturase